MGNMSYCRFENTASDIYDCIDALQEDGADVLKEASEYEREGLEELVDRCEEIIAMKEMIYEALSNYDDGKYEEEDDDY